MFNAVCRKAGKNTRLHEPECRPKAHLRLFKSLVRLTALLEKILLQTKVQKKKKIETSPLPNRMVLLDVNLRKIPSQTQFVVVTSHECNLMWS